MSFFNWLKKPQLKTGTSEKLVDFKKDWSSIVDQVDAGVLVVNGDNLIIYANKRAHQMLGYHDREIMGKPFGILVPSGLYAAKASVGIRKSLLSTAEKEFDLVWRNKLQEGETHWALARKGGILPIDVTLIDLQDGADFSTIVTIRDASDKIKETQELIASAMHDSLTDIPNRSAFLSKLEDVLNNTKTRRCSLFFLDLDHFKGVNDKFGHSVGDEVLKILVSRWSSQLSDTQTLARLSGDEFVILMDEDVDNQKMVKIAEQLMNLTRQTIQLNDLIINLTVSVGIVVAKKGHDTPENVLKWADLAMYAVKEAGRNDFKLLDESLRHRMEKTAVMVQSLREAIAKNELEWVVQPIVAAEGGRVLGGELLTRWTLNGQKISPAEFIPLAESHGLILGLGQWIFREACKCEVEWRERWGEKAPYVSINVSARQLVNEHWKDEVLTILEETGAQAHRIVLEITETVLMDEYEAIGILLNDLAKMGFKTAIDDFGTGYSSLSKLSRLPVHILKIDREFIQKLTHSPNDRSIVRAVIGLGRSLGLKLVAEGVEDEEQFKELRHYGCDQIQGYFLGRPVSEKEWNNIVESKNQSMTIKPPEPDAGCYFMVYSSQVNSSEIYSDQAMLEDIKISSNKNNYFRHITGCLILKNGFFLQWIEGPRSEVEMLMDTLSKDVRHKNITKIIEGKCSRRAFPDSPMKMGSQKEEADDVVIEGLINDAHAAYAYFISRSNETQ